ncbi:MAG: mechanosensitive ion channel family protein, partial [Kiloniellaceae bacterium]
LISGLFATVVATFSGVMIMVTLAWAIPKAVLAPDLPAWRLIAIPQKQARAIGRRIVYVATIFAVDLFFAITARDLGVSDELISFYTLVMKSLEAVAILAILQGRLWAWDEEETGAQPEPATPTPTPPRRVRHFWPFLRRVVGAVAVVGALTALAGFANLSRYVIENLVISGMVVGGLFLLRGLGRELIGAALRSAFAQTHLGIPHKTRSRSKFWLRAALGLSIHAAGLVLILMVWGVPADKIGQWLGGIATEIHIGDVTISPGEILAGVVVFMVVLALTRGAQRMLTDRVFPQTDLDPGVRHSMTAGLGYLGLAIAAMLAVSTVGLDLSNIALIAGALSVGIGFGLQNIVNNFVSGLILLIERPIKVGDWIVVGGNEGTVKRINVRATEIETFQRASVIVPNSEIVAGAVTNWTHKDSYGRVEIPIGVAYGSDVERVRETLEGCLRANDDILAWPEPYVLFRGFGNSSLDFEARGFVANVNLRTRVSSALCFAIDRAFRDAEIEIPFPQQDLHIRSAEGLAAALGRAAPPPRPDDST